jgi:hypothetical protein
MDTKRHRLKLKGPMATHELPNGPKLGELCGRPIAAASNIEERFNVESILACRWHNGTREYKVKWEGYERTSWEPEANFDDPRLLDEFESVVD